MSTVEHGVVKAPSEEPDAVCRGWWAEPGAERQGALFMLAGTAMGVSVTDSFTGDLARPEWVDLATVVHLDALGDPEGGVQTVELGLSSSPVRRPPLSSPTSSPLSSGSVEVVAPSATVVLVVGTVVDGAGHSAVTAWSASAAWSAVSRVTASVQTGMRRVEASSLDCIQASRPVALASWACSAVAASPVAAASWACRLATVACWVSMRVGISAATFCQKARRDCARPRRRVTFRTCLTMRRQLVFCATGGDEVPVCAEAPAANGPAVMTVVRASVPAAIVRRIFMVVLCDVLGPGLGPTGSMDPLSAACRRNVSGVDQCPGSHYDHGPRTSIEGLGERQAP